MIVKIGSTERLDTLTEVGEALPAMSEARVEGGAAVIRDRIYVVGGGTTSSITNSAERFGAWTTLLPTTPRRVRCSATVVANMLYVIGGEGFRATSMELHPRCFALPR